MTIVDWDVKPQCKPKKDFNDKRLESISIHFENVVSQTIRKRRLRCLFAKHPDRLSRLFKLRRDLLEVYIKLTVKIAQQQFLPFYINAGGVGSTPKGHGFRGRIKTC